MNPLRFGTSGRLCSGFHHPAQGATKRTAVLLCPSWGPEFMRCYRGVRMLAEKMSQAGFDTLRFDYSGTGDAEGHAMDARLEHWLEDIQAATRELRDLSGAAQVAVIGIRFGALLADAAFRLDPRGIRLRVYWDPPASGLDYVQQMRQLSEAVDASRRWHQYREMQLPPPGEHELYGQAWPKALDAAVQGLTLTKDDAERLWLASQDESIPAAIPASQRMQSPEPAHWHAVQWVGTAWRPLATADQLALRLQEVLP
jgi:pimeloyl-ACP methyl ester carboxylesterase